MMLGVNPPQQLGAISTPRNPEPPERPKLLPGIAAIGLWMFCLCLLGLLGVSRHKLPHSALVLCVAFALGGHGLLRLRRWGWAITLATAFLSAIYGLWGMIHFHQMDWIVMIIINAILFLYLVRPEVMERLR